MTTDESVPADGSAVTRIVEYSIYDAGWDELDLDNAACIVHSSTLYNYGVNSDTQVTCELTID